MRQHEATQKQAQGLYEELEKQRFTIMSLQQQLDAAKHSEHASQSQVLSPCLNCRDCSAIVDSSLCAAGVK